MGDMGREDAWEVRLLAGSYDRDTVDVQLYGRTRDGKSITVLNRGFDPYFHIVAPSSRVRKWLEGEKEDGEEVRKLEDIELWVRSGGVADATLTKCLKVTMTHPYRVPEYRDRYAEGDNILAADIPFVYRFMFDKDMSSCVRFKGRELKGPERERFSTELVVEATGHEDCAPFHPPLTILSFDIENSLEEGRSTRPEHEMKAGRIFTICCAIRRAGSDKLEYERIVENDEKRILERFSELFRRIDPDVITGYNIENYDIPVVLERAEVHGVKVPWGRDRSMPRIRSERYWRVTGRIVADAWWNAKRQLKPKKETLNAIAELVLGEKKEDVDPKHIDREWKADRDKVVSYCTKDAELALRILENIRVLDKNMDLATVSRLPVDDVINGRTSNLIDSILIREADRQKIGVPMTRRTEKDSKIEGGYVHQVNPGLYRWVITLDFMSMYPSIIITNNICFTTISKKGGIESPMPGVRFLPKEERVGLLPGILAKLMKDRGEAKAKLKDAKKRGDTDTVVYYDGLQGAIKILMNSFYGVFASAFYRFTDNNIGAAITAFARRNITTIIKQLQHDGYNVIYSDTDSVFVLSPKDTKDEAVGLGKSLAEKFTRGDAVLEFEKVMDPFFTHGAKKRYFGKVVWPTEEMLVRGYETRRTDAFDYQSESLTDIFERVLRGDTDGAVQQAKDRVGKVSRGEVSVAKLVISRTAQDPSYYKNPDSMANVQAARKLMDMGYEFVPGMKVSWIVKDGSSSPQEVVPFIDGRPFTDVPDFEYYAKRVAQSLARVTEVFGWDEDALITGKQHFETTKQTNILSAFGTEGEGKSNDGDRDRGNGGASGDTRRSSAKGKGKKDRPQGKSEMNLTDFM